MQVDRPTPSSIRPWTPDPAPISRSQARLRLLPGSDVVQMSTVVRNDLRRSDKARADRSQLRGQESPPSQTGSPPPGRDVTVDSLALEGRPELPLGRAQLLDDSNGICSVEEANSAAHQRPRAGLRTKPRRTPKCGSSARRATAIRRPCP